MGPGVVSLAEDESDLLKEEEQLSGLLWFWSPLPFLAALFWDQRVRSEGLQPVTPRKPAFPVSPTQRDKTVMLASVGLWLSKGRFLSRVAGRASTTRLLPQSPRPLYSRSWKVQRDEKWCPPAEG